MINVNGEKRPAFNYYGLIIFILELFLGLIWHSATNYVNWLALLPLIIIAIYFYSVGGFMFAQSLFFIFIYLTRLFQVAKLGLLFALPLGLYILISILVKRRSELLPWLKKGRLGSEVFGLSILTVIVSSFALIGWYEIAKPNVSRFWALIPDFNIDVLIPLGVGFAIVNSIVEEFIFRGIIWHSLEDIGCNILQVLTIQAIIFGLIHYNGFPGGLSGVGLATIYGAFLGAIRYRSRGLFAPITVHVFADVLIFILLLARIA